MSEVLPNSTVASFGGAVVNPTFPRCKSLILRLKTIISENGQLYRQRKMTMQSLITQSQKYVLKCQHGFGAALQLKKSICLSYLEIASSMRYIAYLLLSLHEIYLPRCLMRGINYCCKFHVARQIYSNS